MRDLGTLCGHTIDMALLADGVIIDVGCRGFEFAKSFAYKKVYCVDPDPDVFDFTFTQKRPGPEHSLQFLNVAISDKNGDAFYYRNGESSVLCEIYQPLEKDYTPCKTITMEDLYKITGTNVDVLKLDCEGAEYMILGERFQPIPKQITVEFHHHTVPEYHNKHIKTVMENLLKYYDLVYEQDTGMDNLFIRKNPDMSTVGGRFNFMMGNE